MESPLSIVPKPQSPNPSYLPAHLPTYRPTYLAIDLPTYRSTTYLPTDPPTYPPTNLPTYRPTYLSTHLPTDRPTDLPTYTPAYRPTYLSTYLPTDRPTYRPTYLLTYLPIDPPTYLLHWRVERAQIKLAWKVHCALSEWTWTVHTPHQIQLGKKPSPPTSHHPHDAWTPVSIRSQWARVSGFRGGFIARLQGRLHLVWAPCIMHRWNKNPTISPNHNLPIPLTYRPTYLPIDLPTYRPTYLPINNLPT
jgi:hypothetical protein